MTEGNFMPELHLKQPGFTYRACGTFTKHCEKIQKFRKVGNLKQLYKNKLDRAYFAHDAATKDINIVKFFANKSILVILGNDIVEQKKLTLISTVNHTGNINNGHYTASAKNNFSPPWYCSDAAVISWSEEVLENDTSYILLYKAVPQIPF